MKCSVEGCIQTGKPVGYKDQGSLCQGHMEAWGYYHRGYYTALDKNNGRTDHKLWEKAMQEFLEWCRVETIGYAYFARALSSKRK